MRAPSVSRRLRLAGALWFAVGAPGLAAQVAPPPPAFTIAAWTTREGIPQSALNSLALDDEGYLWIATALGIARFDGDSFVAYPRSSSPPRPETSLALTRAPDGGLWFLNGVNGIRRILPGGRVEKMPVTDPGGLFRLAIGPGDSIWVGQISGVRRLERDTLRRVEGLPDSLVGELTVLRRDERGAIWVGGSRGLARYVPALRRAERIALACNRVGDVTPAGEGGVWVATCAGLEHVAREARVATLVLPEARGHHTVLVDPLDGALWSADRHGVRRYRVTRDRDGGQRLELRFHQPLGSDGASPNMIISDRAGGLFIATNGAGLRHVRRLAVGRLTLADGLPERPVHHLAPDGTGGLWIGNCGGLARWRDGRLEVASPDSLGLPSACVHGLLHARTGALWVGQGNALLRLEAGRTARAMVRFTTTPAQEVAPLLEDRTGRVWFGTSSGTFGFVRRGDSVPVIIGSARRPRGRITAIAEGADGSIWVGQRGRVSRYTDTTLALQFDTADGLPDAPVRGLLDDRDGSLWIVSYGGGLLRWDATRGVQALRPRGVPFERQLSAIRLDRHDRFWLLGDGGITAMPRRAAREAIQRNEPVRGALEVGPGEGVPEGNGGFPNAWFDVVAERLWVATVDGVAVLDVSTAPGGARVPPVHIDDVRLDDALVGAPDTLRVPAASHALEIHFSTPSFGLERSVRVRYRLRGHDRQWIDAGAARVARYANVAPGDYRFEVLVDPGSGTSSAATGDAMAVRVAAFWWETRTARVLGTIAAAALLWLLFRRATRRIRERNRALQREIAERERAERQAADAARELAHVSRIATAGELATSIAHELNQPLAAVMGSAQQARHLADRGDVGGVRRLLDEIEDQSDRAAGVIRSLRAFVHKEQSWDDDVTPDAIVQETLRLVRQELVGRGIAVEVRDERQERCRLQGSVVQLQQVLANLLLNAADAMEALPRERRHVTIQLRDEPPAHVRLSVHDTGGGIPAPLLERVFSPFYTTKTEGLGLGLSLSRSIVEAHGGRLWAEPRPEGGSVFHILLPGLRP